nr:adenylate kinase [Streptomyces sp. NBC_00886]
MRLLIMGPPGSGKGTQGVTVAERLGCCHISTGDIFRANVQEQTDFGKAVERHIDAGEYVPDAVTNSLLRDRLAQDDARRFVLDGYPRTVEQVAALDAILQDLGTQLDGVISLQVDDDQLVERLLKRAGTSGRTDDTEVVISRRQQVYVSETAPLLAIYRRRGLLFEIDGMGEVHEVSARIASALHMETSGRP